MKGELKVFPSHPLLLNTFMQSSPKRFPACGSAVLPTPDMILNEVVPHISSGISSWAECQNRNSLTIWAEVPACEDSHRNVDHRNVKNQSPFKGSLSVFSCFTVSTDLQYLGGRWLWLLSNEGYQITT